jgi:biotin carboxyl carrier protein
MATVTIGGRKYEVEVRGDKVLVDGHEYPVKVREEPGFAVVNAGGIAYRVRLPAAAERQSGMTVEVDHRPFTVEYEGRLGGGPAPRETRSPGAAAGGAPRAAVKGAVTAQIAGRVLSIKVTPGQSVARGDVLMLLEAMKMENEIKAPADGVVKEIAVAEGARVAEGETLVIIA